jgi:hypothetical protein
MDILIGREVRFDIKADTPINWDEIWFRMSNECQIL